MQAPCQAQEAFREAPEFAKEDAKPSQAGTPDDTLRVFKDGNGARRRRPLGARRPADRRDRVMGQVDR